MSTLIDFTLSNDETIKLTMNFKKLLLLKSHDESLYNTFNRVFTNDDIKNMELLDLATFLYVGYWCANYTKNGDDIYSYDDFLDLVPFDLIEINRAVNLLIKPKKNKRSDKPSK